jgi:hypothetical protein
VADLHSTESACAWAQAALPHKNSLVAEDAEIVEKAFENKLRSFGEQISPETSSASAVTPTADPIAGTAEEPVSRPTAAAGGADHPKRIDKSLLTFAEPRRHRDREHLRWIKKQPCLICGRKPSDAHHLRFTQPRALGRKVSDEFAVPLCRVHHRSVHGANAEPSWWGAFGIDPAEIAQRLWNQTHPNDGPVKSPNQAPLSASEDGKSTAPPDAR